LNIIRDIIKILSIYFSRFLDEHGNIKSENIKTDNIKTDNIKTDNVKPSNIIKDIKETDKEYKRIIGEYKQK